MRVTATMTEQAPAKLNLALHITGRRPDGYHLMESLVAFANLHDVLHAQPAESLTLHVKGEFAAEAGEGEGNLVLKAAHALQAATGTRKGAVITLEKNIPVGAGLGGGSADAAAILRLLNRLWDTKLTEAALMVLAKPLGADVAMCLTSKPAIATSIGDELTLLAKPFPNAYAVLVHPRLPLLTADVYRALRITENESRQNGWNEINNYSDLIASLQQSHNDLEAPARQICPVIDDLLKALNRMSPAPDMVRMTGSGACCFALYETQEKANSAAKALSEQYPQYWVRSVTLA